MSKNSLYSTKLVIYSSRVLQPLTTFVKVESRKSSTTSWVNGTQDLNFYSMHIFSLSMFGWIRKEKHTFKGLHDQEVPLFFFSTLLFQLDILDILDILQCSFSNLNHCWHSKSTTILCLKITHWLHHRYWITSVVISHIPIHECLRCNLTQLHYKNYYH